MPNKLDAFLGWGAAVVIMASIIGGLLIIGGPMKAREQKIDNKRLSNMAMTARVISCYADQHNDLPETLELIKNMQQKGNALHVGRPRCHNISWEVDPVTLMDFGYKRISKNSFEICGVFAQKTPLQKLPRSMPFNQRRDVINLIEPREASGLYCYASQKWK